MLAVEVVAFWNRSIFSNSCNVMILMYSRLPFASRKGLGCGNSTPYLLWFTVPVTRLRNYGRSYGDRRDRKRLRAVTWYLLTLHVCISLHTTFLISCTLYLYIYLPVCPSAAPSNMCTWLPLEHPKISHVCLVPGGGLRMVRYIGLRKRTVIWCIVLWSHWNDDAHRCTLSCDLFKHVQACGKA